MAINLSRAAVVRVLWSPVWTDKMAGNASLLRQGSHLHGVTMVSHFSLSAFEFIKITHSGPVTVLEVVSG
jgi:uncharacterized protein (DUF2126 family)